MLKRSAAFGPSGSRWLPACSLCFAPRAALAAATSSSRSFSRSARDESKSRRSASSSQYLQRQKKDAFVRARKDPAAAGGSGKRKGKGKQREEAPDSLLDAAEGYRSRSAFKLVQLDDKHKFLRAPAGGAGEVPSARSPFVVVDLGGAPGGWTQVAVERLERHAARRAGAAKGSEDGAASGEAQATASKPWRVFALDILPMEDVQGAEVMQGNFLLPAVQNELRERIRQPSAAEAEEQDRGVVDVVLSDMMANTTGNVIRDTNLSLELVQAAFDFACATLRRPPAGASTPSSSSSPSSNTWFIAKIFTSAEADAWRKEVLEKCFAKVGTDKVEASRKESKEVYWVARGFKGPTSF